MLPVVLLLAVPLLLLALLLLPLDIGLRRVRLSGTRSWAAESWGVLKLLGCVNSTLEFSDQHLVVNGASDLLHELYGKSGDGYHARSALGFAQLPTNAAVEVEAIFEIKG